MRRKYTMTAWFEFLRLSCCQLTAVPPVRTRCCPCGCDNRSSRRLSRCQPTPDAAKLAPPSGPCILPLGTLGSPHTLSWEYWVTRLSSLPTLSLRHRTDCTLLLFAVLSSMALPCYVYITAGVAFTSRRPQPSSNHLLKPLPGGSRCP
jgi:hypothetical protein